MADPKNRGVPDDESAGLDQEAFDQEMAEKTPEEIRAMVGRLAAQPPAAPEEPTHEDTAAAALHELLGEDADGKGPPDWYRKAWENT